jgi:alkylhydroperoxidase family enzyme
MGGSFRDEAGGGPMDRHAPAVDALRHAVFQSPGSTRPATRVAAGRGGELTDPLAAYVAKVRDQSYRIGDADFARLTAAGLSDDAIFEITIATAVGAALQRLDAGLRAVRGEA